jgi:hypothetical protein
MPEKQTLKRAHQDARRGKAPTTQAGEFVREEVHHVRKGKHGVRNPKQAIAIGLSKARKAGVKVPRTPKGTASAQKEHAHRGTRRRQPAARRSAARSKALKREGRSGASHRALSPQARSAARRRTRSSRSQAAQKAARTRARGRPRARR